MRGEHVQHHGTEQFDPFTHAAQLEVRNASCALEPNAPERSLKGTKTGGQLKYIGTPPELLSNTVLPGKAWHGGFPGKLPQHGAL